MTCEILISNSHAIAIATDSLTISKDQKTFKKEEKLFELSNTPPMALMAYGNPSILNISIDSLVAKFKGITDFSKTNTVTKISKDFIKFIESEAEENPDSQIDYLKTPIRELESIILEVIYSSSDLVDKLEKLSSTYNPEIYNILLENNIFELVDEELDNIFDSSVSYYYPNTNSVKELIRKVYSTYINETNILIAGFNKDSLFPSYELLKIYGVFNGKVVYKVLNSKTDIESANILPLSQSNSIKNILHLNLIDYYNSSKVPLNDLISENIDELSNSIKQRLNLTEEENSKLDEIFNKLKKRNEESLDEYITSTLDANLNKYIEMLNKINYMSKWNLADLATTLIKLELSSSNLLINTVARENINALILTKEGIINLKENNSMMN